jgi:protein-disulfide isomerase
MFASLLRTARISLPFALIPLTAAAAPAPANTADQQRIEQAVQTYAKQHQAAEDNARDQLIANNYNALLNDPASPVIGNANADVTLIEFTDYACPYCKAVEPRLEQLLKGDKRVKLVVKEFPILTPQSLVGAKAALASVRQGKYEQFHQAMMMFKGRLQDDTIFDIAKDAGLDIARLRKDMQAPEITDQILATFNLARAVRIFQTPAFIVDKHLVTGNSADIDFPKVVASARVK